MTFIASVMAKKGVALIADSLVTSISKVIEFEDFLSYIREKAETTPLEEIKIDPNEIVNLFYKKPSHTKDFEEKLFQYDKYSAIMTAGNASINNKRIEYIVKEIVEINKTKTNYLSESLDVKLKDFCEHLQTEVKAHLEIYNEISNTTFIFTSYNNQNETTIIYKIDVVSCDKTTSEQENFQTILCNRIDDYYKVVCEGQNRISERILFGEIDFLFDITPKIINRVIEDLNIDKNQIPDDYVNDFLGKAKNLLPKQFYDDMKVNKLAGLSLQEAVDLASLLMKIEINFQKFTENIPTVGGVIKLAVIDNNGFRFITGNAILKPQNIN